MGFAKVEASLTRFTHKTSGGEDIRRFYWDWALCCRLRDLRAAATLCPQESVPDHAIEPDRNLLARAITLGVWEHPMQYPLIRFAHGMQHRNFWQVEEVPAARALHEAFPKLRKEFERLDSRSDYEPYTGLGTCDAGQWSEYLLFSGGRRHA